MTDIMKLADDYATEAAKYTAPNASPVGTIKTRAALQSAIEALQAENERLELALENACRKSEALQAKLTALEKQEPVAHFGSAYVNENGVHITTVLGPVAIPQDAKLYAAPKALEPLKDDLKRAMWIAATIELPSQENCYLRGIADAERHHGITKGTPT